MTEYWNYEPRRPRHQATDVETIVEVRRDCEANWSEATLVDISRNGIRLRNVPFCERDETVQLRIPLSEHRESNTFSALVRWCEPRNDAYEIACQCDQPMDWELIGELILTGALDSK